MRFEQPVASRAAASRSSWRHDEQTSALDMAFVMASWSGPECSKDNARASTAATATQLRSDKDSTSSESSARSFSVHSKGTRSCWCPRRERLCR